MKLTKKTFCILTTLFLAGCSSAYQPLRNVASADEKEFIEKVQPTTNTKVIEAVTKARILRDEAEKSLDQAKRLVMDALEKDPNYLRGWQMLGSIYLQNDELQLSLEAYKKALAIHQNLDLKDFGLYNTIGWLYYRLTFYDAAETYLTEAWLHRDSNDRQTNIKILNNLATLYVTTGEMDEAEKVATFASDLYDNATSKNIRDILNKGRPKKGKK